MQNISVTASPHSRHKDITLISVKGFIDTNTAPEFEKTFQSVLGEKRFNLIIDLKEASYISSAGWGIFVGEIKRIRNQKGDLFLVGMNPEVTDIYELLQFSSILKSFPNVELAIQKGFKKTRVSKVVEKPVEKSLESPQAENSLGENKMAISFEEPQVDKDPKKPHWFFRILKPWTWR
jgi:anti-sigma B factor antagonist